MPFPLSAGAFFEADALVLEEVPDRKPANRLAPSDAGFPARILNHIRVQPGIRPIQKKSATL